MDDFNEKWYILHGHCASPKCIVMDALSDLVAIGTGVNPTISLKMWLIENVLDIAYSGIYSFLYL